LIGENDLLVQAGKSLPQIIATLSEWNTSHSSLNHLLLPLQTWLEKQKIIPLVPFNDQSTPHSSTIDHLLNSLLFSVQCLVARCPEALNAEETEDSEKYIMKGYQFVRDFTHYLNLKNINAQLRQSLFGLSHVDFREGIQKMLPFLDLFLALARDQLAMHNNWMKSIFKLDYVLCSLLQNLTQQGFCQPQDSGEPEAGEDASDETGGVGIGEGSGRDNISKDIEDESQVEGLRGEEAENQEPEGKHEGGDAIEMNDDFGGALEDVDEPTSDDENKSEGDDEPEFDETLGELDDLDPSAVDEKMWGDEKGPEDQGKAEEKTGQDHSKEQDGTSEVTAKESKEQKQTKDLVKDDNKEANNQDVDTEDHEEPQMDDGENNDANDPNVNGTKMDDFVKDAETLNLPDEMDLGSDDEMENEGEKEDMADSDDGMGDGDEAPMEDENVEDFKMNEPNLDASTSDAVEENLPNEAEQNPAESNEENTRGDEKDEHEVPPEEIIAQPDLSKESGMTDPNEIAIPEAGESASTGETGTSQGGAREAAATEEKTADADGYVLSFYVLIYILNII
jgi:midasin